MTTDNNTDMSTVDLSSQDIAEGVQKQEKNPDATPKEREVIENNEGEEDKPSNLKFYFVEIITRCLIVYLNYVVLTMLARFKEPPCEYPQCIILINSMFPNATIATLYLQFLEGNDMSLNDLESNTCSCLSELHTQTN